jgi:hypothetical protein
VSYNTTKQKQQISLTYYMYIKRKLCVSLYHKRKASIFGCVTELIMLAYTANLQHKRKINFDYTITKKADSQYVTLITDQINLCRSQNRICCLAGNVITYTYAFSRFNNLLQQFSCLKLLPVKCVLHVSHRKDLGAMRSGGHVTTYVN